MNFIKLTDNRHLTTVWTFFSFFSFLSLRAARKLFSFSGRKFPLSLSRFSVWFSRFFCDSLNSRKCLSSKFNSCKFHTLFLAFFSLFGCFSLRLSFSICNSWVLYNNHDSLVFAAVAMQNSILTISHLQFSSLLALFYCICNCV